MTTSPKPDPGPLSPVKVVIEVGRHRKPRDKFTGTCWGWLTLSRPPQSIYRANRIVTADNDKAIIFLGTLTIILGSVTKGIYAYLLPPDPEASDQRSDRVGMFTKYLDYFRIFEQIAESGASPNVYRMIVVERPGFLALKLLTALPR